MPPQNKPTLDGLLDAASMGVRVWARTAAEWCVDQGFHTLSAVAFAATCPGCNPGWSCVKRDLFAAGAPVRLVLQRLTTGARTVMLGHREYQNEKRRGELTWSDELAETWVSLCKLFPENTPGAEARIDLRFWDRLVGSEEFRAVFAEYGIAPGRLRVFREPSGCTEGLTVQASIAAREVRLGLAADAGGTGPGASSGNRGQPLPNVATLEGFCQAGDPDVREWARGAMEWTNDLRISVLGVAAMAATFHGRTQLGMGIANRIRMQSRRIRPFLEAVDAVGRSATMQAGVTGSSHTLVLSKELLAAWQNVCSKRPNWRPGLEPPDEVELWTELVGPACATFSKVLATAGLELQIVHDVIEERRTYLKRYREFLHGSLGHLDEIIGEKAQGAPKNRPRSNSN